ncbi:MAG: SDR family oxidoreductase [Marinobacter sp.]|nr:SDR family oxidoreductase [Marinobacter sp.]
MSKLATKTALITGGTTGIGYATARLFLEEGATVVITGQDGERVKSAGESLGDRAIAVQADVSSPDDMARVAQLIKDRFGKLDVLFANAGIACPMPFSDVDEDNISRQIDVNLKGVIYSIQSVLPILNNPSSVVITSTTLIEKGVAGMSVYAATKAAVRSLARTLSAEFAGRGIRVNTISPGMIETPIYGKLGMSEDAVSEWAGQLLKQVPAARLGQAEEVAKAVLYMAGDDATYMVGENLLLDGGMASI